MILAGNLQSVDRVSEAFTRSRPAPLERLDSRVPRHRRILRPQLGCLEGTEIKTGVVGLPVFVLVRRPRPMIDVVFGLTH